MPGILTAFAGSVPPLRHALHLHDDKAAAALRGLRHRQHLAEDRLLFHGDVAVLVRGRAAQEAGVDRERLVEQKLLAPERHELDEVLARAPALPAAAVARVDEGVEPGPRQEPRPSGRDLARQLRQRALRQRVALDHVGDGKVRDLRRVDEGAADDALQEAVVSEMAGAEVAAVAEPDRVDRGDAARLAGREEAAFDRGHQRLRHGVAAARAADQDRVAGADETGRLVSRDAPHALLLRQAGTRRRNGRPRNARLRARRAAAAPRRTRLGRSGSGCGSGSPTAGRRRSAARL